MEKELEILRDDLKGHIVKHDQDYLKLLWWIIGTLVTLLGVSGGAYIQYGVISNRVEQVEKNETRYVTNVELSGAIALFDEKLRNISENVNDIKQGLNIK